MFADPISALGQMQAGALRSLAVTSGAGQSVPDADHRRAAIPASTSSPGMVFSPRPRRAAVIRLNAEFVKALKDPRPKNPGGQAMQTVGNSPEQFIAFIKRDIAIWKT